MSIQQQSVTDPLSTQQQSVTDPWQVILNLFPEVEQKSTYICLALPHDTPRDLRTSANLAFTAGKRSLAIVEVTSPEVPATATDAQNEALWLFFNLGKSVATSRNIPPLNTSLPADRPPRPPKVADPEPYTGDRSKFRNFATQLQLKFASDPATFNTESVKIIYAGSYLRGHAYTWFAPYVNESTGHIDFNSFTDFFESLKTAFDDPDLYATAERDLETLTQTASCSQYYSRAVSLFATLGWDTPSVLIHHFRRGLKESIKDALVGKTVPKTFKEFAELCISLDNEIYARAQEKKGPPKDFLRARSSPRPTFTALAPQITPAKLTATNGELMELDNSEAARKQRREYRRANNLCSYCGGAGHYASSCPVLQRRDQKVQTTLVGNLTPTSSLHASKKRGRLERSSRPLSSPPKASSLPFTNRFPPLESLSLSTEPLSQQKNFLTSSSTPTSQSPSHTCNLGNKPPLVLDCIINDSLPCTCMVDSGATSVFIDAHFVSTHKLATKKKKYPESLKVVDGRNSAAGQITHEVDLNLQIDQHVERITFQVTQIAGYPIVLGKAWLDRHDPEISWSKNTLTFSSPSCQNLCLPKRPSPPNYGPALPLATSTLSPKVNVATISPSALRRFASRPNACHGSQC